MSSRNRRCWGRIVGVEVELAGGVAVDVAVEAGHPQARVDALAVVGRVELLLREGGQQELQAGELDRGQDVLEERVEVIDRDDLAPRDVAQLGAVLQEHGRRELGQEGLGQVEFDVEPLEPGEHLDLHLREDLPPRRVLRVRQRRVGERARLADLLGAHLRQLFPGHPLGQPGGRPDGERLAARHLGLGVELGLEVVPALEELLLRRHDLGLHGDVFLHDLLGRLHRPLGVQGIAGEVEAGHLPLLGLALERPGGLRGLRRGEDPRAVVLRLLLLGALRLDLPGRLGVGDGVGRRVLPAALALFLLRGPRADHHGQQSRQGGESQTQGASIPHRRLLVLEGCRGPASVKSRTGERCKLHAFARGMKSRRPLGHRGRSASRCPGSDRRPRSDAERARHGGSVPGPMGANPCGACAYAFGTVGAGPEVSGRL